MFDVFLFLQIAWSSQEADGRCGCVLMLFLSSIYSPFSWIKLGSYLPLLGSGGSPPHDRKTTSFLQLSGTFCARPFVHVFRIHGGFHVPSSLCALTGDVELLGGDGEKQHQRGRPLHEPPSRTTPGTGCVHKGFQRERFGFLWDIGGSL